MRAKLTLLLLLLTCGIPAPFASADPAPAAWSASFEPVRQRVVGRGALVVHVVVPLCDNDQIACGSTTAGDPKDLERNLYWGAVFGQKRFFGKKSSQFERVSVAAGKGPHLERAVFKKRVRGAAWDSEDELTVYVVLDAFRGDAIDGVVDRFFLEAESGGEVTFAEDGKDRTLRVDVVGYAGHNRMMDGKKPPPKVSKEGAKPEPIPSFVMACRSAAYFEEPLRERGSTTLLMTRDLMAPEGYVVHAIVSALGDNASKASIRARTVRAYAAAHSVEDSVASSIFAR